MTEQWIVIPRWDEFQHPDTTRTGNIPWLKTFTRLLSDSSYLDLTAGERALLHGIWLEYARSRSHLRANTLSLSRRLSLNVTAKQLEALNHAGFIEFSASRTASTHASSPASRTASPDETREEEPLGSSSSHVTGARATPANAGRTQTNGTGKHRPAYDIALDRVRNVGAELPLNDLNAELRDALDQRYDELTDDNLIELRDLHAHLAKETP